MIRRLTAAAVGTALLAAGLTAGATASPVAVVSERVAGLP
ncbi:MAG: hypothetical protein JWO60_2609, partial [Frankiales bacterium]|nr:hypothetical protein [Frankiales bacterium]